MRKILKEHITIYRIIVAIGFIAAVILALSIPVRMIGASPWAYYYGVQNFAQGKLVIDDELHNQQVDDAKEKGGMLQQYFKIGDNRWALEKAPGYVFFQVPFELLGIPRWANVILALGMIIVTFVLLKRLRDEKTACIGSLLMLFTPISLIMLNLSYMDTFASLAFLVMGGGLYIYYHLERQRLSPRSGGLLLFVAFLLIAWSVVTRYTNVLVAIVFILHYIITRWIYLRKKVKIGLKSEVPAVILGIGLPLAIMLFYNYTVFGSPLDYGYHYSRMPIEFAFQYLGQINRSGQSVPLQIIIDNLKAAPAALFQGFPLLIIAIPGMAAILILKGYAAFKSHHPSCKRSGFHFELSWGLLLILIGWFMAVFFLYLTYEFTAEYLGGDSSFVRFARFYLPGLFPLAVICALLIARLRYKLYIPIMIIAVIAGSLIYTQYALGGHNSSGPTNADGRPGIQQQSGENQRNGGGPSRSPHSNSTYDYRNTD